MHLVCKVDRQFLTKIFFNTVVDQSQTAQSIGVKSLVYMCCHHCDF